MSISRLKTAEKPPPTKATEPPRSLERDEMILLRISCKNSSVRTGKFLIPIKYRNCNFFSVS